MTLPNLDFNVLHPEPLMVVISGLSGAGKDSVIEELIQRGLPLHFVVTTTSRAPRANEVHGKDYLFVSKVEFERMIEAKELIEYALVYNDYKGVSRAQVDIAAASGKDVLLRVDVQGAARLRSLNPDALLIFIIPENEEAWLHRFTQRGVDTPESQRIRLDTARNELSYLPMFDYVIVNRDGHLKEAADTIQSILTAEHSRVQPRRICL
ncbi:MAG TPA: guanylate kinase [Longilinea sp.]|nr:guanylate kinase [Longilinea sp.]